MRAPLPRLALISRLAVALALVSVANAQTLWQGVTGVSATTNWSDALNWSAGMPGLSTSVLFTNSGAVASVGTVNNVVDAAFGGSIGSLQFANTNNFHTTLIAPGVTLTVLGNFRAGTETDIPGLPPLTNTVLGAGGSLLVNNTGTSVVVRQGSASAIGRQAVLDLSRLDTFNATVSRVLVGVAGINRNAGALYLAKTNLITTTALGAASPAVDIGDSVSAGNPGLGSFLFLGQTNAIFCDSMQVARQKQNLSSMLFNPAFTTNNGNPTALFRNADGASPISTWSIADGAANSGSSTAPTGTNDFTGGTVDLLVNAMTLGRTSSASPNNRSVSGTLTFSAGTINVNLLTNGLQSVSGSDSGYGTINVNGSAALVVNNNLVLGATVGGTGAAATSGALNVRGGNVFAYAISTGAGTNNSIALTNGTLVLTNTAGPGINTLALTNSTLNLPALAGQAAFVVTNLVTGGTTNRINILSVPVVVGYPGQFTLIKRTGAIGGAGFNFGLGTLPSGAVPAYGGYLSNNTATASIVLVLTNGPVPARVLTWSGTASGDWDIGTSGTANWKTNALGSATFFNEADFVTFDDSATGATNVNLTGTLSPSSLTVSNNTKTYTFGGFGNLSGNFALNKLGAGTLIFTNSGLNDFSGGVTINGGALQIGNGETGNGTANLGTNTVTDNAALVFKRADDFAVANAITGSGGITQSGTNTLTLNGANSFTGPATIACGILVAGNSAALGATSGATIINPGGTLDVFGQNLGAEPIVAAGGGVGGSGAIVNSGTNQIRALQSLTLAGDTTFGGSARWDLRAPTGGGAALLTTPAGSPFNLTKVGANQISLVSVTNIDAALGDIDIQQGIFGIQISTAQVGDPAKTITVHGGAMLNLYNLLLPLNKKIILQDGAAITNENSRGVIAGPITLQGAATIAVQAAGTNAALVLNNSITGPGGLTKNGLAPLYLSAATNSYTGATILNQGTLFLNGRNGGGGSLTNFSGTTLAGNGTNAGLVEIQGVLEPGFSGAPGAFGVGGDLVLNDPAGPPGALIFNLNTNNTIGGGVNDLIQVGGSLVAGMNSISINPLGNLQTNVPYRLINYAGAFADGAGGLGTFSPSITTLAPSRYAFTLDTSTTNQVNLIASGGPAVLEWNNAAGDANWSDYGSQDWSNLVSHTAQDTFVDRDTVLLDDSVTNALMPATTLTIPFGAAVSPNWVTNNSSINYTITGLGKISGAASVVKLGSGTLTLDTDNDFTGTVTVLGGTLVAGRNNALGFSAGATTIASGATLDVGAPALGLNSLNLGPEPVFVSGAGVSNGGAIVNNSTNNQQNALQRVTLTGPTSFGGASRWDIRAPGGNAGSPAGASLSTGGQPFNLTKIGTNLIAIVSVTVDPNLADIDVQSGFLDFEGNSTGLGNPTNSITIENGATLLFYNTTNLWNKIFVLRDGATLNNNYLANLLIGPVVLSTNSAGTGGNCTFNIGGDWMSISNGISGPGNLIKTGASTLYLTTNCAYAGSTLISSGTLALIGNGALAGSSAITIAAGAALDASGRGDQKLNLSSGQVLAGNGTIIGGLLAGGGSTVSPGIGGVGALTVANAITLQGTTAMKIDKTAGTNDLVRSSAGITFGGVLNLSVLSAPLAAGDSNKLFSAASYSGTFTALNPPTPGAGLLWDTSSLAVNGTLRVVAAPVSPRITGLSIRGGYVILSGTNNAGPGGTFSVLTSTNLMLPLASWTVLTNGVFGTDGNFSSTNAAGVGSPRFFMLLVP